MRPVAGIILVVVFMAPRAAPATARPGTGAVLYRQYCAACHGLSRTGYAADNAPSLVSPTFRETADDAFLRSAIERGRAGTAMGGYGKKFGGPLTPMQIDAIIAYLRDRSKPKPQPTEPVRGSITNGARVYRTHCATCHGTVDQRGTAVHLANAMFLESASDAFLKTAIVRGRPGTPMEAWGKTLSPLEIDDVVAYLRGLARPVPPPPAVIAGSPTPPALGPIVVNPKGQQASFTLHDDRYVSVADVAKAYQERRRLVIIDARTPSDYLRLHIDGAISIPYFDMKDLDKVPNDGTWVIAYCACPHHVSGIVVDELRKRGYAHSAVLDEGIFAWEREGHPTVAAPGQLPIPAPPVQPAHPLR